MDGDGDLDIVSASQGDNTIAWYENDGAADPTWSASDIATDANGARGVYVSDMDGDGDLDIVSASKNDNTIAWYKNDGAADPTWSATDIATSAEGAYDVHVADMDGDGDLDIVSASANDNTIAWYESNAADVNLKTVASAGEDYTAISGQLTIPAGETSATLAVPILADMKPENDETLTLTLTNANTSINDGTGILTITDDDTASFTLNPISQGVYLHGGSLGDIDKDGDIDIIAGDYDNGKITWFENDGAANPSFSSTDILNDVDSISKVVLGDIDNDGDLDIAYSREADSNNVVWLENDGNSDPSFVSHILSSDEDSAHGIDIADFDGDGDLDIASGQNLGGSRVTLFINDGSADPTFSTNLISTTESAIDVKFADIDNDGDIDLVSGDYNNNSVTWHENNNGSWTSNVITTTAVSVRGVDVADLDGDGDMDITSASTDDADVSWYENDGAADPSFTVHDHTAIIAEAHDVNPTDIDGDGDIDLIIAEKHWHGYIFIEGAGGNRVGWLENNGAIDPEWTLFEFNDDISAAHDVETADIDGDGDLDIVVFAGAQIENSQLQQTALNGLSWYENNCDGNDPLIFDLDGDGIELLGIDVGVNFDADADGELETTGWMSPDDGLLVYDLDDSGMIEDMSEVFSEHFDQGGFTSSINALASLDSNNDSIIDHLDDQFDKLLLWKDINSDGISSGSELLSLNEHGIFSISLDAEAANENLAGNQIESFGTFIYEDGLTGSFAEVTFAVDEAQPPLTFEGPQYQVNPIDPSIVIVDNLDIDSLINQYQSTTPITDSASLSSSLIGGSSITSSLEVMREDDPDSFVGLHNIQNVYDNVLDPITGDILTPLDIDQEKSTLINSTLFSEFMELSTDEEISQFNSITAFSNPELLATYSFTTTNDERFDSFDAANSDGLSHFHSLGSGIIGLEDPVGVDDQDSDDLLLGFDFQLGL